MDTEITQIVEEGKRRPLLDSTSFTFDEVAQAHEYLESSKAIGKIVLKNVW
ncbi:zinc-binding dehydrogenase [Bacillus tropicus]|uniref:zinc-binding dehydrogenase n=1 Tax=Bacillus tropicus TaxID=2026188 RepID=UPI003D24095C